MKKRHAVFLATSLAVLAAGAALLSFPNAANQGIDRLNSLGFVQIPKLAESPFKLGLDLQGGLHLVYQADLSQIPQYQYDDAMEGLRDVLERRVNLFGAQEPVVQTEGTGTERRLIIELAGVLDSQQAVEIIGATPFLEFRELKENAEEINERNTQIILGEEEGEIEDPFKPTPLTGRFLEEAQFVFDPITSEPVITLQFNEEGAKLFEEITERNVGKPVAIYLDGQPLQSPTVQEKITGGRAQISGIFTIQEAQKIARELNAGALPVPITLLSQQTVGPTLGQQSLQESMRAGLLGFALLALFMVATYRIPGILSVVTLGIYIIFLLSLFKLLGVTFTLAGIAGIILSLGMAVDANILIFSRMREELRKDKSYGAALEDGFRRAWPSIRDGNITTLLVALILFWVGSSFVQGFALTLSLGIVLSMATAILVTRAFLQLFESTIFAKLGWLWK